MRFLLTPGYSSIFPGKPLPGLKDVLKDVPSETFLHFICFINGQMHLNQRDLKTELSFVKKMIERLPEGTIQEVVQSFQRFFSLHPSPDALIFPLYNLLKLAERELMDFRPGDFGPMPPEQEFSMLKAVLIENDNHDKRFVNSIDASKSKSREEAFYRTAWPTLLPQFEFNSRKEIAYPVYKGILLFKFLQNTPKFQPYLAKYLELNKVSTYQEYLKKLLELYLNAYRKEDGWFAYRFPADLMEKNSVLKDFIIEVEKVDAEMYRNEKKDVDFKGLREKPILKFKDGQYGITNWNFIIDKLYQGFVFDFYNQSGVEAIYNGTHEQKIGSYLSDIGTGFAEKHLFIKMVDSLIRKEGTVGYVESKKLNYDYYYRKGNHIIIFEFKNITFPRSDKYDEIKKAIDKKLVSDTTAAGKVVKKGVLQLVEQIRKLNEDPQQFEDFNALGIDTGKLFIYPVIVYTDPAWGLPGLNFYLNSYLRKEAHAMNPKFFRVQDLVMFNFDIFLEHYKSFQSGEIDIVNFINKYYRERSLRAEIANRTNDASDIITSFTDIGEIMLPYLENKGSVLESPLYKEIVQELDLKN